MSTLCKIQKIKATSSVEICRGIIATFGAQSDGEHDNRWGAAKVFSFFFLQESTEHLNVAFKSCIVRDKSGETGTYKNMHIFQWQQVYKHCREVTGGQRREWWQWVGLGGREWGRGQLTPLTTDLQRMQLFPLQNKTTFDEYKKKKK